MYRFPAICTKHCGQFWAAWFDGMRTETLRLGADERTAIAKLFRH